MNLHEYQAKQLFSDYGIKVPNSKLITDEAQIDSALSMVSNQAWVVKAQVHAGGRAKAGGVKVVDSKEEAEKAIKDMLGSKLVTYQTDSKGQPIAAVLVEEVSKIKHELYVGATIDRSLQRIVFMVSTEGGVDIENVAANTPEKIVKAVVNPLVGIQAYQCREMAFALNLQGDQIKQFSKIITGLAKLFVEKDLSLIEVNPLVVTQDGQLLCLDGKINIDDNALYRHADLQAFHDPTQEDERELRAKEWDLNYIALDGEIGCMVNGAGLAMATMDLIKVHGGAPANFLDVGGSATSERVSEAFKIITSDKQVKAILVNIFGGIVRCDLIAQGIIDSVQQVGVKVPVVIRLEGNQAEQGLEMLEKSGLAVTPVSGLNKAAETVVGLVKETA